MLKHNLLCDCSNNEISTKTLLDCSEELEIEQTDWKVVAVDGSWDGNSNVNMFHNGKCNCGGKNILKTIL